MKIMMRRNNRTRTPKYFLPDGYAFAAIDGDRSIAVIDPREERVGVIMLREGNHFGDPRILLRGPFVHPNHQGLGIGKALLTRAMEEAVRLGRGGDVYTILEDYDLQRIGLFDTFEFLPYRNHKPWNWPGTAEQFRRDNAQAWEEIDRRRGKVIRPKETTEDMKERFKRLGIANLWQIVWTLAILFLFFLLFTMVDPLSIHTTGRLWAATIATIMAGLIAQSLPYLSCARQLDVSLPALVPKRSAPKKAIFFTMIACIGVNVFGGLLVKLLESILNQFNLSMMSAQGSLTANWGVNLVMFLYVGIAGPIIEEFVYRGVFLTVFRRYGNWFAVIASSLLFGLAHGNLPQLVPTFFIGVIFSYMVIKTGTLQVSMAAHIGNNCFALLSERMGNNDMGATFIGMFYFVSLLATLGLLVRYRKQIHLPKGEVPYGWQPMRALFSCWPILVVMLLHVVQILMSIRSTIVIQAL